MINAEIEFHPGAGRSRWAPYLESAIEAARAAGRLQRERYGTIRDVRQKGEVDLLTEVDLESEKLIKEILRKKWPEHEILAEESNLETPGDSPFRWVIDPLDGTTSYTHSFPIFAASVGLLHEGRPVVGAVYNGYFEELFTGLEGGGACLNGKPISVSRTTDLSKALLATGFGYDRKQRADHYLGIFKEMMMASQGVRRTGSAASDLCWLAAGRTDGFWEEYLQPWDITAGMIILLEAGGKITNFDGSPVDLYARNVCISNGKIHEQMLEKLRPFLPRCMNRGGPRNS